MSSNPLITSSVEAATVAGRSKLPPRTSCLAQFLGVETGVTVLFGEVTLTVQEILDLRAGSMIELNKMISEPATILINGKVIAYGEVVVVDGYYGVRITQVADQREPSAPTEGGQ